MTHLNSTPEQIIEDLKHRVGFAIQEWIQFAPHDLTNISEVNREAFVLEALSQTIATIAKQRAMTEQWKLKGII